MCELMLVLIQVEWYKVTIMYQLIHRIRSCMSWRKETKDDRWYQKTRKPARDLSQADQEG